MYLKNTAWTQQCFWLSIEIQIGKTAFWLWIGQAACMVRELKLCYGMPSTAKKAALNMLHS